MLPRFVVGLAIVSPLLGACGLLLDSDSMLEQRGSGDGGLDGGADGAFDADAGGDVVIPDPRVQVFQLDPVGVGCPAPGEYESEMGGCIFYRMGVATVDVPVGIDGYTEVWGRARGLQQRTPDAFAPYLMDTSVTLDGVYVDGISITTGSPRQHVFTLGAGLHTPTSISGNACPCDGGRGYPPFIGDDWTCETGNDQETYNFDSSYYPDVLWDDDSLGGAGCTPLGAPGEFHVVLDGPASGPLQIRFMTDGGDDAYLVTELVLWVR